MTGYFRIQTTVWTGEETAAKHGLKKSMKRLPVIQLFHTFDADELPTLSMKEFWKRMTTIPKTDFLYGDNLDYQLEGYERMLYGMYAVAFDPFQRLSDIGRPNAEFVWVDILPEGWETGDRPITTETSREFANNEDLVLRVSHLVDEMKRLEWQQVYVNTVTEKSPDGSITPEIALEVEMLPDLSKPVVEWFRELVLNLESGQALTDIREALLWLTHTKLLNWNNLQVRQLFQKL